MKITTMIESAKGRLLLLGVLGALAVPAAAQGATEPVPVGLPPELTAQGYTANATAVDAPLPDDAPDAAKRGKHCRAKVNYNNLWLGVRLEVRTSVKLSLCVNGKGEVWWWNVVYRHGSPGRYWKGVGQPIVGRGKCCEGKGVWTHPQQIFRERDDNGSYPDRYWTLHMTMQGRGYDGGGIRFLNKRDWYTKGV